MIDIHVHLRDFEESHKETLAHGLMTAQGVGYAALFEMPNTQPPLTCRREIERRIAFADQIRAVEEITVFHGMYAGLTEDPHQICEMITAVQELFPRVVGLKLYAGVSTGTLGIMTREGRRLIYRELVNSGYEGVLAVHCEDPSLFRRDDKLLHGLRRPPEAELASVSEQLDHAEEYGFTGHLHICHVTLTESLDIIDARRGRLPCTVSTGVTPHHLLLSCDLEAQEDGYLYTVNPPLRDESVRVALLDAVLAGRIDVLESDHAPHTLEDKRNGASGFPGIPGMLGALAYLVKHGIDGSLLTRMIFENPLDIFSMEPETIFKTLDGGGLHVTSGLIQMTNLFDLLTQRQWRTLCDRYNQYAEAYEWDPYVTVSRETF